MRKAKIRLKNPPVCQKCGTRVLPMADGRCPACRFQFRAAAIATRSNSDLTRSKTAAGAKALAAGRYDRKWLTFFAQYVYFRYGIEVQALAISSFGFAPLLLKLKFIDSGFSWEIETASAVNMLLFLAGLIFFAWSYMSTMNTRRLYVTAGTYLSKQKLLRHHATRDARPFFLFLRAFGSDKEVAAEYSFATSELMNVQIPLGYLDILSRSLKSYGRFLSIGPQPLRGPEAFPRWIDVFADADCWHDAFVDLASKARLIFLIPEVSESVLREMKGIMKRGWQKKTVVLMRPESESAWESVRERVSVLGCSLPRYCPQGLMYIPNDDFSIHKKYPFFLEEIDPFFGYSDSLNTICSEIETGQALAGVIEDYPLPE